MQRVLRVAAVVAAALILPSGMAYAVDRRVGRPGGGQVRRRQMDRQGRQPDLQDRSGRHRRLVHLCRLHPLFSRVPALPWPRRHGLDLCSRADRFDEAPELLGFLRTVAGGKKDVSSSQDLVMPAQGENKNVMCFIDAIYSYLRARGDDAVGRGRPEKHAPKPAGYEKAENECMG